MSENSFYGVKLPIYYVLTVISTDGQKFSEDPKLRGKISFNEQILYYEALFRVMEEETWISGFFSERWDWFDQYKRSPKMSEAVNYDQTGGDSPRNKLAEKRLLGFILIIIKNITQTLFVTRPEL